MCEICATPCEICFHEEGERCNVLQCCCPYICAPTLVS